MICYIRSDKSVPFRRHDEGINRLTNCVNDETNLSELRVIQDETTIEHEGRLLHHGINMLPVVRLELIPLSHNAHGVSIR